MKKMIIPAIALSVLAAPAMAADADTKLSRTNESGLQSIHKKYQNFKDYLDKEYGFTYDGAISELGQWGAPGGKVNPWQTQYYGEANWNMFNSETFGAGSVQAAVTRVHYYWTSDGAKLGSNIGVATDVNDYSSNATYINQLSYTHRMPGKAKWLAVTVGQFPMYMFDGNPYLSNQQTDFNNLAMSQNGTYTYPSASMGAYATMDATDELQFVIGAQDATNLPGTAAKFNSATNGDYTGFAGATYKPNIKGWGDGKYNVLVYNQPSVKRAPEETQGWSLSASQDFGDKWAVFGRINGNTGGYILRQSYVLGAAYKDPFERGSSLDRIGLAAAINKINQNIADDGARGEESVVEAYWDIGFAETLLITPDIQMYYKPALNRDRDIATVYSIRATILF